MAYAARAQVIGAEQVDAADPWPALRRDAQSGALGCLRQERPNPGGRGVRHDCRFAGRKHGSHEPLLRQARECNGPVHTSVYGDPLAGFTSPRHLATCHAGGDQLAPADDSVLSAQEVSRLRFG